MSKPVAAAARPRAPAVSPPGQSGPVGGDATGHLPIATTPIAVTMGDPAGIGPDTTLTAWLQRARQNLPPFFVIACPDVLAERASRLGLTVPMARIDRADAAPDAFERALPVLPCAHEVGTVEAGRPNAVYGNAVVAAIETAVDLVERGLALAVVTNPIAKSVLYQSGFRHPGHTEFLGELAARRHGSRFHAVMMLAAEELRVVPLTVHIPLARVASAITTALILETARITASALIRDFGIAAPRLAVAGLNPHAGENGTIGHEETEIIAPAIAQLQAEGLTLTGPHAADTLFHASARERYDAVIAMYHDQALIPLKTLAFDRGVNITLGLPFVRTSPDHGTAFDIAGTGRASPVSLIESIKVAYTLAHNRARHDLR